MVRIGIWAVALLAMIVGCNAAIAGAEADGAGVVVEPLVNEVASAVKLRVGYHAAESPWEVGGVLLVDAGADLEDEYGYGAYMKHFVDPNATIPLSDWLGFLGDGVPDTLNAEGYLVGEATVIPKEEGGSAISGSVGVGAKAGPLTVEWMYSAIEGGSVPGVTSGPSVWFGAIFEW
jgi:hypothetical protein